MTDANGQTSFTLKPGASYRICEVLQANWQNSDPGPSATGICKTTGTLRSGTPATGLLFGNYQNVSIPVYKYHDLDGDGTKDANEPLLSGWTIKAYRVPSTTPSATQTTNSSGSTTFSLRPGQYRICEVLQSRWSTPTRATCRPGRSPARPQ